MKSIDIKSLLIGALLTSTVIFGVAATNKEPSSSQTKGRFVDFEPGAKKKAAAGQWEVLARPYSTTKFADGYVNLLGEPGLLIRQGFEPFSVVARDGDIDESYIFYRRRH